MQCSAHLHLLTDLDELGHLALQLAVPLHQVGQVVLQGLLQGKRRGVVETQGEAENADAAAEISDVISD